MSSIRCLFNLTQAKLRMSANSYASLRGIERLRRGCQSGGTGNTKVDCVARGASLCDPCDPPSKV